MSERLDTIRLYNWKQLTNDLFIQKLAQGFVAPLHPPDPLSPQTNALTAAFRGAIYVQPAPVTEFYGKDMRLVTVELRWQTGELKRKRSMSTLVSRYGTQKYIY